MAEDWSRPEVELIVTEYFKMLMKEQTGIAYNKAESRRAIQPLLQNRSEGSVEFKHQNISAVLAKINQPYINGYKPRWNYQQLLEEVVLERLGRDKEIEKSFK